VRPDVDASNGFPVVGRPCPYGHEGLGALNTTCGVTR